MYDDRERLKQVDDTVALPIFDNELERLVLVIKCARDSRDIGTIMSRLKERVDGLDIIRDGESEWGKFSLWDRIRRQFSSVDDVELVDSKISRISARFTYFKSVFALLVNFEPGHSVDAMYDLASVANNFSDIDEQESVTASDRAVSLTRTLVAGIRTQVEAQDFDSAKRYRDQLFELVDSGFSLENLMRNEVTYTAVQNRNYQTRFWLPQTLEPIATNIELADLGRIANRIAFMDQKLDKRAILKSYK